MLKLDLDTQTVLGLSAVILMAVRSYRRKSLTGSGITAAVLVGTIHAIHPFRILTLLLVFFVCGTKLTTWGGELKEELLTEHQQEQQSDSSSIDKTVIQKEKKGRTATQVFCNSGPAAILALLHIVSSSSATTGLSTLSTSFDDLLVIGIVSQYACSAADTFSSEIGILDDNWPLLITTGRKVPPGTNGAVTILGLLAALMGSLIIGLTAALVLSHTSFLSRLAIVPVALGAGLLGTLLDSLLGATCQRTLYDTHMKKVVEMHGGSAVPINHQNYKDQDNDKDKYIVLGHDLLDNNQVNLVSALLTILITIVTLIVVTRVWSFLF